MRFKEFRGSVSAAVLRRFPDSIISYVRSSTSWDVSILTKENLDIRWSADPVVDGEWTAGAGAIEFSLAEAESRAKGSWTT